MKKTKLWEKRALILFGLSLVVVAIETLNVFVYPKELRLSYVDNIIFISYCFVAAVYGWLTEGENKRLRRTIAVLFLFLGLLRLSVVSGLVAESTISLGSLLALFCTIGAVSGFLLLRMHEEDSSLEEPEGTGGTWNKLRHVAKDICKSGFFIHLFLVLPCAAMASLFSLVVALELLGVSTDFLVSTNSNNASLAGKFFYSLIMSSHLLVPLVLVSEREG